MNTPYALVAQSLGLDLRNPHYELKAMDEYSSYSELIFVIETVKFVKF